MQKNIAQIKVHKRRPIVNTIIVVFGLILPEIKLKSTILVLDTLFTRSLISYYLISIIIKILPNLFNMH